MLVIHVSGTSRLVRAIVLIFGISSSSATTFLRS
jgi:hypothetical protein